MPRFCFCKNRISTLSWCHQYPHMCTGPWGDKSSLVLLSRPFPGSLRLDSSLFPPDKLTKLSLQHGPVLEAGAEPHCFGNQAGRPGAQLGVRALCVPSWSMGWRRARGQGLFVCVYVSILCSQKAEEMTENSRPERQKEQLARRGLAAPEGEA